MRHRLQLLWIAITNPWISKVFQGTIYQGKGKFLCVPGLNCYSCPSALGACPVGAVQAMLTGASKSIPYYALGFLLFFGTLFGRAVCGFLCPFGFVQDLLHKIPCPKVKSPPFLDKLRLNWVILLVFVLGMPLFLTNQFNMSDPAFCKWICPSGTLLGGIPLVTFNEGLRSVIGALFSWKMFLLLTILTLSTVNYRPFCRYFCPLGAFYGLFNKFSLYRLEYKQEKCTHCNRCHKACKLDIPVTESVNDSGCIRCGDCVRACPHSAITLKGFSTECNQSKKLNRKCPRGE